MFSCSLYKTSDELVTRLRRSYILYRGKPVFVEAVDGMKLVLLDPSTKEVASVSSKDEGISLDMPPLGYVNTKSGAEYFMRRPLRMYKQGLSAENLGRKGRRGIGETLLTDKCFLDMLQNEYPSLTNCFGETSYTNPFEKTKASLKAFHKHLAVDGSTLHHKGRAVGSISEDKTFKLKKEFAYLGEEIEEYLNEC